jgi:Uncharacterised protein family (UPF0227).
VHTPPLGGEETLAGYKIETLTTPSDDEIAFMGSSLAGYYALYFSHGLPANTIFIGPSVRPLDGLDVYLGQGITCSPDSILILSKKDVEFVRSVSHAKFNKYENTSLLLESGRWIL